MKFTIIFKSGHTLTVHANEIEYRKDDFRQVKFVTFKGGCASHEIEYIKMDEVAAITSEKTN